VIANFGFLISDFLIAAIVFIAVSVIFILVAMNAAFIVLLPAAAFHSCIVASQSFYLQCKWRLQFQV
jgi:hypothetical protein